MAITQKRGRLIGVLIASASDHEVRLVEGTLDACVVSVLPAVLIGDKAYDSDPLAASLGLELFSFPFLGRFWIPRTGRSGFLTAPDPPKTQ